VQLAGAGRPGRLLDILDLETLIARCRTGDELAWEAFVRQFQGRVYGLARTYVADSEEAADLAQDIFIRLFETRKRWVSGQEFTPWMFRVARNLAVDFLRRRKVRRPAVSVAADEVALPADPGTGPEALAIGESRRGLVRAALARISAMSREVLVLRDIHGLSVEEAARVLGVPTGTVKSRASRARAELAERVLALGRGRSDV
jgi:RNA polymerase sigma-70 factor (ECF subfamily)